MPEERELTITSYAILGMLAIQPWSTYSLTQQMRRSLRHVWPRAESNVYAEPKRLVAAGLAASIVEQTGKRERTVYTITPEGRAALQQWLSGRSSASRFESEALLKVLFASEGSREDLLRNVQAMCDEARETLAFCDVLAADYLQGTSPFQERAHLNALIFRWIRDHAAMQAEWATWATAQVEGWPESGPPDPQATRAIFQKTLDDRPHS
jgi:PadR family transcriptional regulator, regulatory protein AphA